MPDRLVVQFVDSREVGGAERSVVHLSSALASSSHWRPLIVYRESPQLVALMAEAQGLGLETRPLPTSRIAGVGTLASLTRALRETRPQVFHAHLPWPLAARIPLIAAGLARVPAIVATAHLHVTLPYPWQRLRARVAPVDRYLAVSNYVARGLVDNGINPNRIAVIHHGIAATATAISTRDRAEDAGHTIVTVGRLVEQKGHQVLIEALAALPDVLLLVAGDGPLRGALEAQAGRLGLADRVRFLGNVDDVPSLLARAEVFVLTSFNEGLPLAVLEALGAGLPVVATRVGGTPELVLTNVNGILVEPGDAKGTAAAVRTLLDDPNVAARLGQRGNELVREHFTVEKMVEGVVDAYDGLMVRAERYQPTPRS